MCADKNDKSHTPATTGSRALDSGQYSVCVCVCGRMQSNWIYALVVSAPDEDIDEVERLRETGSCVCPRNSWDFAALASSASLQSETCLL